MKRSKIHLCLVTILLFSSTLYSNQLKANAEASNSKNSPVETTIIRNADWVVGWDNKDEKHIYLKNADVVFTGNTITYVGHSYAGSVDKVVQGDGYMVMPGLINIHSHASEDTFIKGTDDHGVDASEKGELEFFNKLSSPEVENDANFTQDPRPLGAEVGYSELLLSGVTTMIDISETSGYPGWIDLVSRSGMRSYLAPMVPSFDSEDSENKQLSQALKLIDKATESSNGRLSGAVLVADSSLDGDFLKKAHKEAIKRSIPFKIHASQSFMEVQDAKERHNLTPIQYLNQIEVLGPETILAHTTLLDNHPLLKNRPPFRDIEVIAQSGASVAHAPYAFALNSIVMHSFGGYLTKGVNVGIGTDTFGHNMLEEMRTALMLSRVVTAKIEGASTTDVFNAATIGGAKALQRDDIGKLTRGAKADIVLVNLNHPYMQPVNDPIRSLTLHAADRAVQHVYIDGKKVVENGKVLTLNHLGAAAQLNQLMQPGNNSDSEHLALPLKQGQSVGISQVINNREVLSGHIEKVPYEVTQPPAEGLLERAVVPYGMSRTLDVAVVKQQPEVVIDIGMPWHTDWLVLGVSGEGKVEADGKDYPVKKGTVVLLPSGTSYNFINNSNNDWEWFSIHPHDDYQYKIADSDDEMLTDDIWDDVDTSDYEEKEYKDIENQSVKPIYAQLSSVEFPESTTRNFSSTILGKSGDFELTVYELKTSHTNKPYFNAEQDIFLYGLSGTTGITIESKLTTVEQGEFVFIPQGTAYSVVNSDSNLAARYLTVHKPAQ